MNEPLLKVENVVLHYGTVKALKGVSLEVKKGQSTALIGANGTGKTTLLNVISGLLQPTSGAVTFEGERISGLSPRDILIRGISHVPEGRKIFPSMTVYENLKMGAFIQKDRVLFKRDLETVYALFPELKNRAKQAGGTLSGGEQQMLAIGRALMRGLKLLMMDEPTIGLSPIMVKVLAERIIELGNKGIGILLVEQNVKLALELTEQCYLMDTGGIVLSAASPELIKDERVVESYLGG